MTRVWVPQQAPYPVTKRSSADCSDGENDSTTRQKRRTCQSAAMYPPWQPATASTGPHVTSS